MSLTPSRKPSSGQHRYCLCPSRSWQNDANTFVVLTSHHVVRECIVDFFLQGAQWALVVAVGDIPTVMHPVPTRTRVGLGQQRAAPQPGHTRVHLGKILLIKDYRRCECHGPVTYFRGFISRDPKTLSACLFLYYLIDVDCDLHY